ncbi:MAG: nucleotidyl transferase AbiEii/AbiGii toxin family protein [Gammaproteobacteria bacterium]
MLNDLAELIELTYQQTGIAPGLVEKDYYVTQVINHISQIKNEYFKLVFAGGTCLAKAHKITKRMSEDIDFKVIKNSSIKLVTKKHRAEFSKYREQIISVLENSKFTCDPKPTEGRNTHVKIHVDYPAIFPKDPNNREYILLELTISEVKLPTRSLSINTLMQEMLNLNESESFTSLDCISVEETAAEKWVALTRRVAESARNPVKNEEYGKALVRHIYDLYIIGQENKFGDEFISLSKETMRLDQEKYKLLHKEYYKNPTDEIKYSLHLLQENKFKIYYDNFIQSLVYDSRSPSYVEALSFVEKISETIMDNISTEEYAIA